MSVLCEAVSVIVLVRVLEEKFHGGLAGYVDGVPNQTFCSDGVLTRVGFQREDDATDFVQLIIGAGLRFFDGTGYADIAIADELSGPTLPCPWLEWAKRDGVARVWAVPGPEGELAVPPDWVHPG